jgi:predicted Zn-dependent protease
VPNAAAIANGTMIINSGLFSAVENEAQLAFVLGHEIAHATQEHTMRQMEFHHKKRVALALAAAAASAYGAYNVRDLLNLVSAAITNGYQRSLENQADRLGMEYMLSAGYDPREAPRAWKAMSLKYGDSPTNFFWSSHDNNATRRSYLMAELRNNYAETEFAAAKRDSDEFHRIAGIVAARQRGKGRINVKY